MSNNNKLSYLSCVISTEKYNYTKLYLIQSKKAEIQSVVYAFFAERSFSNKVSIMIFFLQCNTTDIAKIIFPLAFRPHTCHKITYLNFLNYSFAFRTFLQFFFFFYLIKLLLIFFIFQFLIFIFFTCKPFMSIFIIAFWTESFATSETINSIKFSILFNQTPLTTLAFGHLL